MWLLTVRLSAPVADYFQALRQLLDRRDADTYLVERDTLLHLASPHLPDMQYVAAWTLRHTTVQTLALEYVSE